MEIDSLTHQVTLKAEEIQPGREQIQFLVRDSADNIALGTLAVMLLRGGAAPIIRPLPQIILEAGGEEERLVLTGYVSDEDTPSAEIVWQVSHGPGVAARVEGQRLFVSVPADQRGIRELQLIARDPQENQATAPLEVVILEDADDPIFTLQIDRHPVFQEVLELHIQASEILRADPELSIDGAPVAVERQGEQAYLATYQVPLVEGERFVDLILRGFDPAGNEGVRQLKLALRWMAEPGMIPGVASQPRGGSLSSADLCAVLNISENTAREGRLATLYQLGESEVPPGSEAQPVYAVDLAGDRELDHPATLNFFAESAGTSDLGILRWDEASDTWEELPTRVDQATGWLAVTVRELGLFRVGRVSPGKRLARAKLSNYPNPFSPSRGEIAQIDYELSAPGPVRLEIFNILGQRIRLLVDEVQDVGIWSATWNGRDEQGHRLSSGMYFYELIENGKHYHRALLLVR